MAFQIPGIRLPQGNGELIHLVFPRRSSWRRHDQEISFNPQCRSFDLSPHEDERATLKVLAQKVFENGSAAEGFDGDHSALPDRDGPQDSQTRSAFEALRNGDLGDA
jgi:hypothetical protein